MRNKKGRKISITRMKRTVDKRDHSSMKERTRKERRELAEASTSYNPMAYRQVARILAKNSISKDKRIAMAKQIISDQEKAWKLAENKSKKLAERYKRSYDRTKTVLDNYLKDIPRARPDKVLYNGKPNIYYILAQSRTLVAHSGCMINEINMLKALSKFANVYYNNKLFDPDKRGGGIVYSKVLAPIESFYDFYIVRGNDDIFDSINSENKIRFAIPVEGSFFNKEVKLYTLTEAWKEAIDNKLSESNLIYSGNPEISAVYNFGQIVDDMFVPRKGNKITRRLRDELGAKDGNIIIGHFGRLVDICFPDLLLDSLGVLSEKSGKKITMMFCMTDFHIKQAERNKMYKKLTNYKVNPNVNVVIRTFPYENAPYAISACDLTAYNYSDKRVHYTGSMKNLESMSCGVPVIAPDYKARIEEFGADYPLFYDHKDILGYGDKAKSEREDIANRLSDNILKYINLSKYKKNKIRDNLILRASNYSLEAGAKRLEEIFLKIKAESQEGAS